MSSNNSNVMVQVLPTWSYREASEVLKKRRDLIAETARCLGVERPKGKPLDFRGLKKVADFLGVKVVGPVLTSSA